MKRSLLVLLCFGFLITTNLEIIAQCSTTQCPPGDPSPANSANQACVICSLEDVDNYSGNTAGFTPTTVPGAFCGSVENNQWIAFVAPQTSVTFDFNVSGCSGTPMGSGIQVEVYSSTNCTTQFTSVSNCWSTGVAGFGTITATPLVVGQTYYMMIDGWAGDICNFDIDVTDPPGGGGGSTGTIDPVGPISGVLEVCPGAFGPYSIDPVGGASTYEWTITPAIGSIVGNSNAILTSIQWNAPGVAQVCVEASSACAAMSQTNCVTVVSTPIPPTFEFVDLCLGESVICAGQVFTNPGSYDVTLQSWQGCDSVVTCNVLPIIIPPTFVDPVTLCAFASYDQCGTTLFTSGFHNLTCTSYQGCDSIIVLDLAILDPIANIAPPGVIGCDAANSIVTLDGTGSNIALVPNGITTWFWSGPGVLSDPSLAVIDVDVAGTYCLELTHERDGVVCIDEVCVEVFEDTATPDQPLLSGLDIVCDGDTETYTVSTFGGPPPTGYTWATPGGEPLLNLDPTSVSIDWTGSFGGLLCVTADNDCGSSPPDCINVTVNQGPLDPIVSGPTIVCDGALETYSVDSPDPNSTYMWTVPAGASINGSGSSITVDFGGASNGQVCVTASNDCGVSNQDCIDVTVDQVPPEPGFSSGALNVCGNTNENYCVFDVPEATSYTWITPLGTFANSGSCYDMDWTGFSSGQICVTADNDCGSSQEVCVDVTIDPAPTADLSGTGDFCAGSGNTVDLTINLTGTGPWTVDYTIDGNAQTALDISSTPFTLTTGTAGMYVLTNVGDQSGCPGVVNGSAEVIENPLPTSVLTGGGAICQGSGLTVDLTVTLTGTPDWTINWTVDGAAQAALTASASPFVFPVGANQAGTIEITDITDGNGCMNAGDGSTVDVIVNDAPTVTNISTDCNITNTGYTVSFTIVGGDAGSYSVTPATGNLVGDVFTSDEIPSGDGYSFEVNDANNCSPVTVDDNAVLCDCTTEVGNMDATPILECGDGPVTATYDNGHVFDGDDILVFYLHEGSGTNVVNTIATNDAEPTFGFDASAGMTYGTTYYISAVVGNDDGNALVDFTDNCHAVAQGTPVTFFEVPEATLSGMPAVCVGEQAGLTIDFTGSSPWNIEYDDGEGNLVQVNGINTNPFTLNVSPSATATVCLTAVSNTECTSGVASGCSDVTINTAVQVSNVQTTCNPTNTAYVVTFEITGGDSNSYTVDGAATGITPGTPAIYTSNEISTSLPFSFLVDDVNSCEPVTVSQVTIVCDCTTEVGAMDLAAINECSDGPVTATYDPNGGMVQTLDGDDVVGYALHTGTSDNLGTVITTNDVPEFSFDGSAGMTYGTTYYISAMVGNDDGMGAVDVTDQCLAVAAGTPITFFEIPTAELSGSSSICNGDNVSFPISFSGDAPWTVVVSDGTDLDTVTNINSNPFDYSVNPTNTTVYSIVEVFDNNCPGMVNGNEEIIVNEVPTAINLDITINGANTGYTVTFEITGGDPTTYVVTPAASGVLVGNIFTSNEINCGDGYNFMVDDGNACGPEVVSQQSVICNCVTEAGDMNTADMLDACGIGPIDATGSYLGGENLDGNDALCYVLHEGDPMSPLATNTTASFNFLPGSMTAGTEYYICAVAGDDNGSGCVDFNDPCISFGECVPVVYFEVPTASIAGDTTICAGEASELIVSLTGVGPWELTYDANPGGPTTETGIMTNTYSIPVTPGNTTIYSLTDVSDSNCPGNAAGLSVVNVNTPPSVSSAITECESTNSQFTVTFQIFGGDTDSYTVDPPGSGTIDPTGLFVSNFINAGEGYQFFIDDANGCGPIEVSDLAVVCDCTSNAGTVDTDVTEVICGADEIQVTHNGDHILDGNDVLCFMLHAGDNVPLLTSSIPTFAYDPAVLTYGTEYYVCAVVGDDDGSGCVDLTHPCTHFSPDCQGVVFREIPHAILSGDDAACLGDQAFITIEFIGTGPFTITYEGDGSLITVPGIVANPVNIPVTPSGDASFVLTSILNNFCDGTFEGSANVTVHEAPEVINLTEDCDALNENYTVSFEITGGDPNSYEVSGGGSITGNVYTSAPIFTGNPYQFFVDDGNDCGPILVTGSHTCACINEAGDATGPFDLCQGESSVLNLEDNLTGNDAGGQWFDEDNNPINGTFNTTGQAAGVYTFTYVVAGIGPCPDDEVSVTVNISENPVADAGNPQELNCNVNEVDLGGPNTSTGNVSYQWTDNVSAPNSAMPSTTDPGTYMLTVIDNATGCTATDQVIITQSTEAPEPHITVSGVSCFGDSDGFLTIDSVTLGAGPYLFSFNGGPFTSQTTYTNLDSGDFTIAVEDSKGCQKELSFMVEQPDEVIVDLNGNFEGSENVIDLGDSVLLTVDVSIPFGSLDTIVWMPPGQIPCDTCQTNWVDPSTQTTFSVMVDKDGCTDEDQMTIFVRKSRPVFVPNAFSPNADGVNDLLQIYPGPSVQGIRSFLVFNRWGETVFQKFNFVPVENDPELGWDGMYRGEMMNPAVFTWFAEVIFIDGSSEIIKGDAILVR